MRSPVQRYVIEIEHHNAFLLTVYICYLLIKMLFTYQKFNSVL